MNTETKVSHTPGPWIAEGWRNTVVNSVNGDTITAAPGGSVYADLPEIQANARLIAAAPELLEALELAENWLSHFQKYYKLQGSGPTGHAIKIAKEVIAKAKGLES